jgi:aldehyde:ferredoxin oxidoreductase
LGEWAPRKLLRVNLSSSKIKAERIPTQIYRDFLGSKGFSAQLLFKELKTHTDPMNEVNKLVFMTGPLTGTAAPAACKFSVATRSPLTGTWLDSHCGGFWGPELRFAGFEGIIIEGRALKPAYLHIEDSQAHIRDASDLWGKSTFETMEILKDRHKTDRTVRVASI